MPNVPLQSPLPSLLPGVCHTAFRPHRWLDSTMVPPYHWYYLTVGTFLPLLTVRWVPWRGDTGGKNRGGRGSKGGGSRVSFTVQFEEGLGVELVGVQTVCLLPHLPQLSYATLERERARAKYRHRA